MIWICLRQILKSSENSIVKREYLKGVESLFEQTDELDTEISALTYGVDIKDAGQLPMKNLINQALNNTPVGDFADYSTRNEHFYSILREVVDNMDAALLNNAINDVAILAPENLNEQDAANLEAVWGKLAKLYKNSKEKETSFRDEVKTLMIHCTDKASIGKHFLKLWTAINIFTGFTFIRKLSHYNPVLIISIFLKFFLLSI